MATNAPTFAHALSIGNDPDAAADQIVAQLTARLPHTPDFVALFVGGRLTPACAALAARVRRGTGATHLLATTAAGVIAGASEIERRAAVSAIAGVLPDARVTPLTTEDALTIAASGEHATDTLTEIAGDDLAATFLVADPRSVPIAGLVGTLGDAHAAMRESAPPVLFGGVASGGDDEPANTLVLDDHADDEGVAGLCISGSVRVDVPVSQGARPFGPMGAVTRARGNLILEIDNRPALEVVREIVHTLDEDSRKLLSRGLLVGKAVNRHKPHLGRGDYLVRNLIGADEASGGVAVEDRVGEGDGVRLHLRDAVTATEDIELLLNAQQLHGPPAGVILVSCNGRGERFFGRQNHDAVAVQRAFLPHESGSEAAKSGEAIPTNTAPIPLAGFFAAGEIGPVGRETHLHGYTASMACFRAPDDA